LGRSISGRALFQPKQILHFGIGRTASRVASAFIQNCECQKLQDIVGMQEDIPPLGNVTITWVILVPDRIPHALQFGESGGKGVGGCVKSHTSSTPAGAHLYWVEPFPD